MNHLLALFLLLLVPVIGSANGVERGDKLKAPPVANISRKVQNIILTEVERRCEVYDRNGRIKLAVIKVRQVADEVSDTIYAADVTLHSEDSEPEETVSVMLSVYPAFGEAVQIWKMDSKVCAPDDGSAPLLGYEYEYYPPTSIIPM